MMPTRLLAGALAVTGVWRCMAAAQTAWTCVPGVGLFRVRAGAERANYSAAGEQCREDSGELAHVVSEARTAGLSTLLASKTTDSKNRTVGPVRRAFVNLDDVEQEGLFVTSAGGWAVGGESGWQWVGSGP